MFFLLVAPALVQPAFPSIKPIWVTALPQQEGRIYALGMAPLSAPEAQSMRQASDQARAEVISRLRATVKSDVQVSSRYQETRSGSQGAAASRTQNVRTDTRVQTRAVELPGLVVEETYLDRATRTAYALAYLDIPTAERELRTRYKAQQEDLAADQGGTGARARLRRIQSLKTAQEELAKLDDLAGLISAGGADATLRSDVRKSRLQVTRQLDDLRASLIVTVKSDQSLGLEADIKNILRNAVLSQGLGWSDKAAELTFVMRMKTGQGRVDIHRKAWWEYQNNADFIVARGALELTLVDRTGQEYESTTLEAKGVGTSEFQAEQNLLKDFKAKLGRAVETWLADLVQ
jgi:hypothetical protein